MSISELDSESFVNPTRPPLFKAWILFFLVANVGGFFVGLGVGVVLGFVLGMAQVPINDIQLYGGIAGFIVGIPVSYAAFCWSVKKYLLSVN